MYLSPGFSGVCLPSKTGISLDDEKSGASFKGGDREKPHGKKHKIESRRKSIMVRKTRNKKANVKITGIWIIFMAVFIAELFLYTWSRVNFIGVGYEISNESRKQHELTALQNNLKIELASLRSPERIAKIAKNQLGLMAPTQNQTIVIP